MNAPHRWRPWGRNELRALLIVTLGVLAFVIPAAAQTITQRQLEYDAARDFLNGRTKSWEAQEELWHNWMDSLDAAERSGDRSRLDEADRRVLREAMELQRLGRLVDAAKADLSAKRTALQDALESEISLLVGQVQRVSTQADRTRLNLRVDDLEAQAAQLRTEESEQDKELTFLYVRVSAPDPRQGVRGILNQIELSERRLTDVQRLISQVENRIAGVQRRIQRTRQAGDAATSLDRFGAGDPVGANRRDPGSNQVTGGALTPQDELVQLTSQLELLESLRRQLSSNVADLRGRIPRGGGIQ